MRLLILNKHVPSLIGHNGQVVKEMVYKSRGAKINFDTKKESERSVQECSAYIFGSLAAKQDAVCIILEELNKIIQNMSSGKFESRTERPSWRREEEEGRDRRRASDRKRRDSSASSDKDKRLRNKRKERSPSQGSRHSSNHSKAKAKPAEAKPSEF